MKISALPIITVLLTAGLSLFAFDGEIICTKSQNVNDQWNGILSGRPPRISQCSRVVRLEPFNVYVFFSNPAIRNGRVKVTGSLTVFTPIGKKMFESPLSPQAFPCKNNQSVFLFPDCVIISFDPPDPTGEYSISAELHDENSGQSFTARTKIRLLEDVPAKPDRDPLSAMSDFYRSPAPQNIIPGFTAYLENIPELKKKQQQNFNPLSALALFYFALQANPQLLPEFATLAASLKTPEERLLAVIIIHELGEKPFASLPQELQSLWKPHLAGCFQVEKVTRPSHLDILWSEFFITGKLTPLRKIIDTIQLIQNNLSPEAYKKLPSPGQAEKESLMRYINGLSALWSVGANLKSHQLIAFYLEAMLTRNEISDRFTTAQLAQKLKATPPQPEVPPQQRRK